MRKPVLLGFFVLIAAAALPAPAAPLAAGAALTLRPDGTLPLWLSNGPFEIRTTGFGDLSDAAPLAEKGLAPRSGRMESNPVATGGESPWLYLAPDAGGYADFHPWYGWKILATAEKVWYARIVYAWAEISSATEQRALLHFGGNTIVRILLNDSTVYHSLQEVNAVRDGFTAVVTLHKGSNRLLIVTATSHRNHAVSFFDPIRFEWGFYCRLAAPGGQPLSGISLPFRPEAGPAGFSLTPTFFYRQVGEKLLQKYLLEIQSDQPEKVPARLKIPALRQEIVLPDIALGINARSLWLPEPAAALQTTARLECGRRALEKSVSLKPLPKYELYFMPMTHMDIGYTNPQPVVIERQLQTLDQAAAKCAADPEFRWTIETMWQLENYRCSRSAAAFDHLIALIKSGRIAVSPLYTNPYTGWVSEAEMAAAFRLAEFYHQRYGLDYFTAVYNDVPGQSWALPQYLRKAGVRVLVDGINELFSDYKYQQSLPKVFRWAGSSRDTLLLYLTEAYTEGSRYGLERDTTAIANRIWHRVNNLLRRGYPYEQILISGAFSDNSGIALAQYEHAREWNRHYAWPRFIIATLDDFGRALHARKQSDLRTVRGDWTSDWDILYQGETRRMVEYREVQNQLPGVELLATLSAALNPAAASGADEIAAVYDGLLNFSGHGSGLEYGLGSREENLYTDAVRAETVHSAWMRTRALRERLLYRLTAAKESFSSHGVIVFNTLTWTRSLPVEIDFPETDRAGYAVLDLASGKAVPAYRRGARLTFIAPEVPGVGSRQFELTAAPEPGAALESGADPEEQNTGAHPEASDGAPESRAHPEAQNTGAHLAAALVIENKYYRISATNDGWSLLDKTNLTPLFDAAAALPALVPLRKRFQLGESFTPLALQSGAAEVERNAVYEEIAVPWQDPLFRTLRMRLWHDLNRIDVAVELDLSGQQQTAYTEEYGLAFPFKAPAGKIRCETLGGLTGLEERFSAVGHTAFSIRRAIGIESGGSTCLLASPDCRVFVLDTVKAGRTAIANLLNNFPESWNRNEEKQGIVTFRFSLARMLQAEADPAVFGWEVAAAPLIRRSFYDRTEPLRHYLQASTSRVKLISLRPVTSSPDRFEMLLQNSDPAGVQEVTVRSDLLLTGVQVTRLDLLGRPQETIPVRNSVFTLTLGPNELVRIGIAGRDEP
ncbi:MAG TPA: hypothetical protein PL181_05815 [bacterium]|nr:hypothetical protein [bacterium]